MPVNIVLPQWGMGMNDGKVIKWLKKVGDTVSVGDPLVEIESSKVNSEVEATEDGTIGRISVEEGKIADVGATLGYILKSGETEADLPEEEISKKKVTPTSGGRKSNSNERQKKIVATPRARRLAQQVGVDLNLLIGTGPSGRITEDDVRKGSSSGGDESGVSVTPSTVPVREVIAVDGMRAIIARRMTESSRAPTVTLNTHADVTLILEVLRQLTKDWRSERIRPQYQDLVIAAISQVLGETPQANAHFVGDEIRILDEVNLGIAIAVADGLVVPVIKDANNKSPIELAKEVRELAKAAKSNSLSVEQMTGGTFSITNLGNFNIETFNPLLNPPEIGILGLGRVEERLKMLNREVVVGSIAHFSLSFDHRAWDGAPAAQFLRAIVGRLEDPKWLLS